MKELPAAPDTLSDGAKTQWYLIGGRLIKDGRLEAIHLPTLELLCDSIDEWRKLKELSQNDNRPSMIRIVQSAASKVERLSRQFGLLPQSGKTKSDVGTDLIKFAAAKYETVDKTD